MKKNNCEFSDSVTKMLQEVIYENTNDVKTALKDAGIDPEKLLLEGRALISELRTSNKLKIISDPPTKEAYSRNFRIEEEPAPLRMVALKGTRSKIDFQAIADIIDSANKK